MRTAAGPAPKQMSPSEAAGYQGATHRPEITSDSCRLSLAATILATLSVFAQLAAQLEQAIELGALATRIPNGSRNEDRPTEPPKDEH